MQNYELLIDRISKSSGIDRVEVERMVEAKKAKLSGLISKEGAAQIIAAELGISFDDAELKISELMPGMKKVNVFGKVVNIFPIREYEKRGQVGRVANFIIADETGSTRVVLWDTNHIAMIESGEVVKDIVVEIRNGMTRENEIHLSGFAELKKSSKTMDNVKTEILVLEKSLDEARQGQVVKIRGIVVSMFPPRFYFVCPTCNKKVVLEGEKYRCAEHGEVASKSKAILNFVIDDGTETMRVVMFSDQISMIIPEEDLKDASKVEIFKEDFLGSEIYLSGTVKRNQLFNNLEIVANNIEKVDVEKLIVELEAKK